jgi:hypothetical protein
MATLAAALVFAATASASGSGSFSPTGSLGAARAGPTATLLGDGRVLVAGGTPTFGTYLDSAEVFNPATNSFSPTGPLLNARGFAGAARLPNGKVLIAGGDDALFSTTETAELFDPATNTFSATNPMGTALASMATAPLPDGRVLLAGGFTGGFSGTTIDTAQIFDPATNTFSPISGTMTSPRSGALAAPLPDGRVLIAGGYNGTSGGYVASAETFNPGTGTFSAVGSMSTGRSDPAGGQLPDGRVLVAGGYDGTGAVSSAEVFDPKTNTFSSAGVGSMSGLRDAAGGSPLADGRVLLAGGSTDTGPDSTLSSAEIYAATNTFSYSVKGKSLVVTIQATGKVSVSDAASPLNASAAKKTKKKRKLLLKASSASGDPTTITVPLVLSKLAKQRLRQKGKVTVSARITFTPQGGLANTQNAKLKIKGKKPKKH